MSRPVLVTAPYFLPVLDRFRARLLAHRVEPRPVPVEQALTEDELLPLVGDVEGMICGDDEVTARVIEAAPRLRVIAKWGVGVDSIDQEAAARRGVRVCRTPGAFDDPVADSALAYILAFARRTPWLDREVRAGRWAKLPGFSLAESTVGVVGCGSIGRAVARRARSFGAQVMGSDPSRESARLAESEGVRIVRLAELLAASDFVSLHAALDAGSRHLISERELGLMRPSAYLINTARGQLVDEPALCSALSSGTIAGAGLDVFEKEPLPADSPLRRFDSVLLGAHNANSSPAAWERVHESTVSQLLAGLPSTP
jgi:D-3-phosphoglycerate dehydrogenase / 2-oxoglutarate reductase